MSYANILTRAAIGITAPLVSVEVHISNGLPGFQIVGLPDTSVKESKDRVRSALVNSDFLFPQTKVTVNLSPGDIIKQGSRFDLAIAIGILVATKQIDNNKVKHFEFYGELGLSGTIRPITSELPISIACGKANRVCVIPQQNAKMASLSSNTNIVAVSSLTELFTLLNQTATPDYFKTATSQTAKISNPRVDMADIIQQSHAKRALEIAAAGKHNILFFGPPGTGKSMLAQALPGILPELSEQQALETQSIYSLINQHSLDVNWLTPPFRTPHHTASSAALVGGGSIPKPGEISLAHNGVLFLDELTEFPRRVLDVLREPLETGEICISRANQQISFPARFQLIAALNPSPTGDITDGRSTFDQILKYLNKISGPLLDRIDIQIEVPKIKQHHIFNIKSDSETAETSTQIKQRVLRARKTMLHRANKTNAELTSKETNQHCFLGVESQTILQRCVEQFDLSARSIFKIIKVARTIADLENKDDIEPAHMAEAISYRAMDKLLLMLKK